MDTSLSRINELFNFQQNCSNLVWSGMSQINNPLLPHLKCSRNIETYAEMTRVEYVARTVHSIFKQITVIGEKSGLFISSEIIFISEV